MLDTITKYINMIIEKFNDNMIVKDKGNNTLMKGLQSIIIIIALAYIFASIISVFKVNINLM